MPYVRKHPLRRCLHLLEDAQGATAYWLSAAEALGTVPTEMETAMQAGARFLRAARGAQLAGQETAACALCHPATTVGAPEARARAQRASA